MTIILKICAIFFSDTYQNNQNSVSATNQHYEFANNTGPYIPISECITGVRSQVSVDYFIPSILFKCFIVT